MERRKFIKACCYSAISLPIMGSVLSSCGAIYYAKVIQEPKRLVISKSEFWTLKKDKEIKRHFVMITTKASAFPICLYNIKEEEYAASLLECTHKGCELNVGGGIYSCPCHGSEFTIHGEVVEGPADRNLTTFVIETDEDNIYVNIS